jgi:hypothetical protein
MCVRACESCMCLCWGWGGGSKRPRGVDTVMWRLNIALSSGVTIDEKTIV